jgi:hypothetical protein
METELMIDEQLLFEEDVRLTKVIEYGFSWTDFAQGKTVPPQGARFDIYFTGNLFGEKVNGTIEGIDYLEVRGDGKLILNLHAILKTEDGETIKIEESGINREGDLRLNMQFHTNSARYTWLNSVLALGVGKVNFHTGQAQIKVYAI